MEFRIPNTIPVPGFIVAEIIDTYDTDLAVLIMWTTNAIKRRARLDGDPARSQIRAELATYVVHWLFGLTVLRMKNQDESNKSSGVATKAAYPRRTWEWSSGIHKQYLAVKARLLLLQSSPQDKSNRGRQDDAIRSLAQVLEHQAVVAKIPADTPTTKPKDLTPSPSRRRR